MKIQFSVLTYKPSLIADEKINVGVLFHDIEQNNVYLEITNNWSRIKNFDDEIDIDIFKLMLQGMKKHAERNIKKLSLEKYIKRYNNELKFGKVMYKNTDNIDEFITITKKMFMPYEFDKIKIQ